MKKIKMTLVLVLAVIMCSACSSGVSQEEYDKVVAERDSYKQKYEELIEQQELKDQEMKEQESESIPEETTETEETTEAAETIQQKTVYEIGETWEIDGQWKITVNSVVVTDDRNQYAETEPDSVYIIDYSYENLGYEGEYTDGLYIDFSSGQIVDSLGVMGYSYPADISSYPQETPVGVICNAQAAIGVDNAGNFTITLNEYDGNDNPQKATFNIAVE